MNPNLFEEKPHGGYQAKIQSKSGEFMLSVIAGLDSYSQPRADIDDPAFYSMVEVAVFTKDGEWASLEQVKPLFPIIGMGEYEYVDDSISSNKCVWGYVDISLIDACVEAL